MSSSQHVSNDQLIRYLESLTPEEIDQVERHVEDCPECQARLAILAGSPHPKRLLNDMQPPDHPLDALPRQFGNYELLEVIAVGGQGVVYRARQVHINKEVALKLVNPSDRHRSLRELEVAGNLEHEHLVRVYHVGEHASRLYFTMKLAEKGSLEKHIEQLGLQDAPVTTAAEREVVEERKKKIAGFMAKIARAVHYIHEQRIIHRDLKPRNILLDAQGEPLVTDFGLALRVGEDPDKSHTPGYAPPEQIGGAAQTHAVDVFGLGVILFQLLTSRTPFVGTTQSEMDAHTADEEQLAPLPSVYNHNVGTDSDLERICLKCLAKDPKSRYDTAAKVADDLERVVEDEPISLREESWPERWLRKTVKSVNSKLLIPGIARWRSIDFWDAGLNLAVNGVLFALIQAEQPPALLWGTQLTYIAVWWWMFLTRLFRHDALDPAERHLALLWGGVFLGA
jgi:serine/threonine-protein kinase